MDTLGEMRTAMALSKLTPRETAILETIKRGIEEGKVQEEATVSFTSTTGDDDVVGSVAFWDYMDGTYQRELDNMGLNRNDVQSLARVGFFSLRARGYQINAQKILSFMS
jgi:hypothetical protein